MAILRYPIIAYALLLAFFVPLASPVMVVRPANLTRLELVTVNTQKENPASAKLPSHHNPARSNRPRYEKIVVAIAFRAALDVPNVVEVPNLIDIRTTLVPKELATCLRLADHDRTLIEIEFPVARPDPDVAENGVVRLEPLRHYGVIEPYSERVLSAIERAEIEACKTGTCTDDVRVLALVPAPEERYTVPLMPVRTLRDITGTLGCLSSKLTSSRSLVRAYGSWRCVF